MHSTPLRTTRQPAEKRGLNYRLRRVWLPRLAWLWIGGAILVGAYVALGDPLTPFIGLKDKYVALAVVPFMMLMLASGLAWLVVLVNAPPRPGNSATRSTQSPDSR